MSLANSSAGASPSLEASEVEAALPAYALNWSTAIGVLLLSGIFVFISLFSLWHTDIWAHSKFGRWMLDQRTFPDREPFTPFSDPSQTVVQTQWLTQIIYALTIEAGSRLTGGSTDPVRKLQGSVQLMLTLHLLVMTATFVFLWLAYRRIGGSTSWANLSLLLVFIGLLGPSQFQRPQMMGMLCFAILLFVLSRKQIARSAMLGLPIVMTLWANLHGTFAVGFAFFGWFVLTRLTSMRLADRQRSWRSVLTDAQLLRPAWALLISLAAVAYFNPHGPMLYWHVATFGSRPNLHFLNEWSRIGLRPGEEGFWPFAVSVGIVIVIWLASGCARFWLVATAVPFAVFPLLQQRMMTWWLPLAGWLASALGPPMVVNLQFGKWIPDIPRSPVATALAGVVMFIGVCFFPLLQWLVKGSPRGLDQSLSHATCWELGLEMNAAPDQRGRWLPKYAEAVRDYPDGRFVGAIFPTETMGEYLVVVTPSETPVLVYGHAHLFSPAHFELCMNAKYAKGDWRSWMRSHRVNMIVLEPDRHSALANELRRDTEWQIVTDEAKAPGNRRPGDRKLIAIRKKPV
jgi:hypothetical protein